MPNPHTIFETMRGGEPEPEVVSGTATVEVQGSIVIKITPEMGCADELAVYEKAEELAYQKLVTVLARWDVEFEKATVTHLDICDPFRPEGK